MKFCVFLVIMLFLLPTAIFAGQADMFNEKKFQEFCNKYPDDELCLEFSNDTGSDGLDDSLEDENDVLRNLNNRTQETTNEIKAIMRIIDTVESE